MKSFLIAGAFAAVRRYAFALIGAVTVLALPGWSPASAGVSAEDTISYPDGSLFGANGGSGWVGGWTGFLTSVMAEEAVGADDTEFTAVRNIVFAGATPESVGLRSGEATSSFGTWTTRRKDAWTACIPNPCPGTARISFDLPVAGPASLAVFDATGRLTVAR